jgi:hypothetical protein
MICPAALHSKDSTACPIPSSIPAVNHPVARTGYTPARAAVVVAQPAAGDLASSNSSHSPMSRWRFARVRSQARHPIPAGKCVAEPAASDLQPPLQPRSWALPDSITSMM